MHPQNTAAAREALGGEAFAAAWAEGLAMTQERAVTYALGQEGASPASP